MFKKGDIVWCKIKGEYSITNYKVKCIILNYRKLTDRDSEYEPNLEVRPIEGMYSRGCSYWVQSRHFTKDELKKSSVSFRKNDEYIQYFVKNNPILELNDIEKCYWGDGGTLNCEIDDDDIIVNGRII